MRTALSFALVSSLIGGCLGGPTGDEDEETLAPTEEPAAADGEAGTDPDLPDGVSVVEEPFTSDRATLMNFVFSGEVWSSSGYYASTRRNQITAQLMYMVGHLNEQYSGPWLHRVTLSNITYSYSGGLYRIRYNATMPVAWGSKTNLPTSYRLRLPKRIDSTGQTAFLNKYGTSCNDGDDGSTLLSNFWYHYRTGPSDCALAPADVLDVTATVSVAAGNTTGVYPEYHKVWEDGQLKVVAIFGKYAEGATSNSDAGIAAWNNFVTALKRELPGVATVPANLADAPGAGVTDATFRLDTTAGRITVTALLVDKVTSLPVSWDKRYAELTADADLILYNGHAGLGANVRSLATKGKYFPGKYQMFFMNGCDTFSYSDAATTLTNLRAPLNPDDAGGTKYMDFVSNAMPAYFHSLSPAVTALIRAMRYPGDPKTFQAMFRNVDAVQVVVATGEQDNVFSTSYDPGTSWNGFEATGAVAKGQSYRYQTETLPAGKYAFALTPDWSAPGGDADLYVRVGAAPDLTSTYKCKSYYLNSNERCAITLSAPAVVHMAVRGDKYGVTSKYELNAFQLPR